MTLREHLRMEHGEIMKVLARFQKMLRSKPPGKDASEPTLGTVLSFMDVAVDRCHHGKEEAFLFPGLDSAGLQEFTRELRREHQDARTLLDDLTELLRGAAAGPAFPGKAFAALAETYIALIRSHIRKENARLLPAVEERLPDALQARMEQDFEALERTIDGLEAVRRSLGISRE